MKLRLWHSVLGSELDRAFNRNEPLSDILSTGPAIYIWRRNLNPPIHVIQNPQRMNAWLSEALAQRYTEIPAADMAHFIHIHGVSVGGDNLSLRKEKTLKDALLKRENREWLREFVRSLTEFSPPLYVGEADSLSTRIRDHLRGDTNFADMLQNKLGLSWNKLILCYCPLDGQTCAESGSDKDWRTLLEMIATVFGLAGCTARPG